MKKSSKKKPKTVGTPSGFAITSNNIDRISKLPDEILHYILSFVDIVDVVRLSVLSRRWKPLWTTMPYLDFDIALLRRRELCFQSWVAHFSEHLHGLINWVLMCQVSTKIIRFRLYCGDKFCYEQIIRWIRTAVRRNVQELELKVDYCETLEAFELPNCLVRCESLRVLKLTLSRMVLQLPSYLKFNQLTSLHLELIELNSEDLTRSLFTECSFLEDLSLIDCIVTKMKVLDICSVSLKGLTISNYFGNGKNIYTFHNCEIRISCPKLFSFTYMGGVARNYCLDNIPALDYICIDIFPEFEKDSYDEVAHLACKILQQVENIKVLKLHVQVMRFLSHAIEELQCFSTTFCRLKSLNLSIEIAEHYTKAMFLLLKHCPNLESLTIVCDKIRADQNIRNEHKRLHGEHQLRFTKFMLKNGLVLERFIVKLSENVKYSLSTVQKLLFLLQ